MNDDSDVEAYAIIKAHSLNQWRIDNFPDYAIGERWMTADISPDQELRKKHPALQDAWEQYQTVKRLVQE